MAEQVPTNKIENFVGAKRHPTDHIARLVSKDDLIYILHSKACLDGGDLMACPYTLGLDRVRGNKTLTWEWGRFKDQTVLVRLYKHDIYPVPMRHVD